jgi:peptide deformylase
VTERTIRIFGDPVLKTRTEDIIVIDEKIRSLVDDLLDSVKIPGRAGVAATQIGVGLRAFSYNVHGEVGYILNPRIVETRGEVELVEEGCLSVPQLWFMTPRYPFARVEGIDLNGKIVVLEGEGLMAQALQHECDHLDGLVYLDRLDQPTRKEAMRQVRESEWF